MKVAEARRPLFLSPLRGRRFPLDTLPGAAELLTDPERRRLAGLRRPGDREDFLAAHVLARRCAGLAAGVPGEELTLVQRCPHCGDEDHGRPGVRELARLHLSLSHTAGYVTAAAGGEPVGVDVERTVAGADVVDLALAPAERAQVAAAAEPVRAFLRFWVRKEALVKLGELTLDGLAAADLSDVPDGGRWHGLHVRDWSDGDVQGAVVSADPPTWRTMRAGAGPG